jgi:hypothetical protein
MTLVGAAYRPSGVIVRFEVALWDGTPLFRGEGKVLEHRAAAEEGKLPGLDIRFLRLDARGKSLVDRILHSREARRSVEVPDLLAAPIPSLPPPASAPLAAPSLADPTELAPPVEPALPEPALPEPPPLSEASPDTERGRAPEPVLEPEPTILLATPLQPDVGPALAPPGVAGEAPRGLAALRGRGVREVGAPEGREALLERLRTWGMHRSSGGSRENLASKAPVS